MKIQETRYKDAPGWLLEENSLQVTVLQRGAKLQSIRFERRECLCQNSGESFRFAPYGAIFETGEFSGFDDMFPNISAGAYPGGVWDGVLLPDHGEVWTQDWDCRAEEDGLACSVYGVRLPYRLQKRITLSQGAIVLQYQAQNPTAYPIKYIWAAHPLFELTGFARLDIEDCREIVNAASDPGNLGDFGQSHNWPVSRGGRDMRMLDRNNVTYNKYYVWNAMERNCSHIQYPDGTIITLEAPVQQVPYMGVWTDEGGYGGYDMGSVAPEPCTGAFDSLALADRFGKISEIPPKGTASWWLKIHLQKGGGK